MFPRRQKYEKPPSPPWLKWLIFGFILLAVIGSLHKHSPVHQAVTNAEHNLNPHINLTEYKHLLFPQGTGPSIKDIKEGSGAAAACGQEVTVSYEKLDNNKPQSPLTFRIGAGQAPAALERGVEGMKVGGRRSIVTQTGKDKEEQFEVTLKEIVPPLPAAAATPYRVITISPGMSPVAICGADVTADLTLWSMDGKKLYATSKPITFTPGKSEVFLGLAQGVLGLGRGGKRLLIVPPQFQRTIGGNAPKVDFPFPKNQIVLVEVTVSHPDNEVRPVYLHNHKDGSK